MCHFTVHFWSERRRCNNLVEMSLNTNRNLRTKSYGLKRNVMYLVLVKLDPKSLGPCLSLMIEDFFFFFTL